MIPQLAVLTGSDSAFSSIAFSPDGRLLAAGQKDGTITVWDLATRTKRLAIPGSSVPLFLGSVSALGFSSDSNILAWGTRENIVTVFDLKNQKIARQLKDHESAVHGLVFGPDNRTLMTATKKAVIRFWDLETGEGKVVFEEETKPGNFKPHLQCLAFDPKAKQLALGVLRDVLVLDVAGNVKEVVRAHVVDQNVMSVSFSSDGKRLAIAGRQVNLWEPATQKQPAVLPIKHVGITLTTVAFCPKARILAVGIIEGENLPSHVHLWDIDGERELGNFVCHNAPFFQLAWSSDGKTLATGSIDKTIRLWNTASVLKLEK